MSDFDQYYGRIYGSRWKVLRESLLLPPLTLPYGEGLAAPYYLDAASVLAALSLRLPGVLPEAAGSLEAASAPESAPQAADLPEAASAPERADLPASAPLILDACAAPGGKTLVIASRMGKNTGLLANDLSPDRRRRLAAALDRHLFPETRSRVRVSGFDAAALAGRKSEQGRFAAVLLDAPCSSERHVIQDAAALEQWTPARPRFLARRQWALLSAAFLLLAPGGSLVYAACSINPEENDSVAEKLVKKYGEQRCILDRPDFSEGEASEYGRIIMPDVSSGAGPLYVARFRKGTPIEGTL